MAQSDDWGIELDDLDSQPDITNILYYGNEGTGKTTHVATMANAGKIVIINAEGGAKKRALERRGINTANISTFPKQGTPITFDLLENLYWKLASDLQEDPKAWVGIVWDSVTDIHTTLLANIRQLKVDKVEKAGMEVEDPFFIDRSYYGTMTEQMRLLLRRYRDLPCHLALTALMRRDQDDDGEVSYGPAVTPALQNDLMGFMDLVCHTEVRQVGGVDEYIGVFKPAGKYRAKERLAGAVPKQLIDPTFERVHAYAVELLDIESDPVMQAGKERRTKIAEEKAAAQAAEAKGEK